MGFVGHVSRSAVRKQLLRAIDRSGYARSGNREIRVLGDVHRVWTFAGPWFRLDGRIDCFYYGKKVLSVDFVNKRLTDGNWHDYNSCTRQTIGGYEDVLFELFHLALPGRRIKHTYSKWMKPAYPNTTYGRFVERAAWVQDGWFLWEKYDEHLAGMFETGQADLQEDQNWRWFDYDWDQHGNWTRRFINADAERRFRQKERRWQRTSKTTKTTSSSFSTPVVSSRLSTLPCGSTTLSACLPGMEASPSSIG